MKLFNYFNKDNGKVNLQEDDPRKKKPNKLQKTFVKAVGSIFRVETYSRDLFTGSEYNLQEIKEAIDTDSYVKIAMLKYSSLFYKSGWKLKAENQEAIDYILKRFKYMSIATNKPMDILFQEVSDDLYKYSNAFLLKSRVDSLQGIKANPVMNKKIVGGYFRVDPSSIRIKRDKHGNVIKYLQGYGEEKKEFSTDDVIHFYMDKEANNSFGTPRVVAALDDVKLLRKIEGNVATLIHRHAVPFIHWKIGSNTPGMGGTDPEITRAKQELQSSTLDSTIITNERSEIKAIGLEGATLNAKPYLEYFENRVFSALGVSSSQMGRSGAKQDAESMEAQVHDTVKYVQRIMSTFIEHSIIPELLLEGGFDIFDPKNNVRYKFEEISLETKIKKENHEMTKYQSNLITLEEARRNIGIKDEVDENRLYQNLISTSSRLEEIDRAAKHTMDLEKFRQKSAEKMQEKQQENQNENQEVKSKSKGKSLSNKKPRTSKDNNPNGTVESRNKPENQHGVHSVKIKESLNISKKTKKEFNDIFKIYQELRNEIDRNKDNNMLIQLTKTTLLEKLNNEANKYKSNGVYDAVKEIESINNFGIAIVPNIKIDMSYIENEINVVVNDLFKDIKKKIKDGKTGKEAMDILEYRLRFLTDFIARKCYWYAFAKTGAFLNIDEVYVVFNSEKDAEERKSIIKTKKFNIEDIPAYHSFCGCKLTYKKNK